MAGVRNERSGTGIEQGCLVFLNYGAALFIPGDMPSPTHRDSREMEPAKRVHVVIATIAYVKVTLRR